MYVSNVREKAIFRKVSQGLLTEIDAVQWNLDLISAKDLWKLVH